MAQWEEVDPNATWPAERYRAVGKLEHRIIPDPGGEHSIYPADPGERKLLEWVLVVRRLRENGADEYLHFGHYRTVHAAKASAEHIEQREGPPPRG
jgi:hypothetical protein